MKNELVLICESVIYNLPESLQCIQELQQQKELQEITLEHKKGQGTELRKRGNSV